MRFGDIFFRDFVQINGDYYMLDMRFTPDAGNECMAFYCNRQGKVTSGLEAWSKRGMRLTRSEFNKCKQDFIEYMKKKAPDAVDPYGCLEYAYGEDDEEDTMKTIRTVQIIEDTAMAAAESKERTNKIIKAFIAEIKLNLCKGNSVGLFEFGTFSPKHLAEREGKNPQTGEMMHIKGKDTVRFKPSRKFVDTLND